MESATAASKEPTCRKKVVVSESAEMKPSVVTRQTAKRAHEGVGDRRMSLRLRQDNGKGSDPSSVILGTKDALACENPKKKMKTSECSKTQLKKPQAEPEHAEPSEANSNLRKSVRLRSATKMQKLDEKPDKETSSSNPDDVESKNNVTHTTSESAEVVESENSQSDSPSALTCDKKKPKAVRCRVPCLSLKDKEGVPKTSLAKTPERSDSESEFEMESGSEFEMESESEFELESESRSEEDDEEAAPPVMSPLQCPKLDRKDQPFVLLKSVLVGEDEYQCDRCTRTFTCVSKLVRHQQCKDGTISCSTDDDAVVEASLPCNMCARRFSSANSLKRHKLLHVMDGRRCRTCGVLFCKLHSNILISSQTTASESEDGSTEELESSDLKQKSIETSTAKSNATTDQSTESDPWSFVPLLSKNGTTFSHDSATPNLPSQPSDMCFKTPSKAPSSPPKCSPSVSSEPQPASFTTSNFKPKPADYPAGFIQPHLSRDPKLPPGLEMFASHYLTSSYLEVKRNHDYLLKGGTELKMNVEAQQAKTQPIVSAEKSTEKAPNKIVIYELPFFL
ncbi:zinc finger and BTB domain-containing protein 17-like [Synchiropus splendidus]|uniref:zinc finger and BTB domain-containing protein 17-like n=1 Tax=Synchiropus splendidus TaxID=270530 RepID=UPI00237E7DB2|nr:zinc finger and BTB domain-containing protein 17-like [Synchiropus splendidus]XP_053705847.1 zinc finger and BTB domain-containing protein 17-like [Synchiropus splendidus]